MPNNGNKYYDNEFMSNEIEDLYKSYLDLQDFCTIDNTLTTSEGMKRVVNVYTATDGTEILEKGQGNSKDIEVDFIQKEYRILLAQNRFTWYDEEHMTDEMVYATGSKHSATDLFNTTNKYIYDEFLKTTNILNVTAFDFSAFVDGASMLNCENLEGLGLFSFVSPEDVGTIRKALKDDLKYVSEFVKTGYVGTVGGVQIYTKKDALKGTITLANNEAVTIFNKEGTDVKFDRDEDTRRNRMFSRKYFVPALTDETKAVIITTDKNFVAPDDSDVTTP